MNLALITDIVQAVNLAGFVVALATCLYIGWKRPRLRLWLAPVVTYLVNGALFYAVTVLGLSDPTTRMLWSAALRIHALAMVLIGLAVLWWMARDDA